MRSIIYFFRPRTRGQILIVILVLVAVLALGAASFLRLLGSMNWNVIRSETWNHAFPIAEAGVEEALAHLRQNVGGAGEGWFEEDGGFVKTGTLDGGFYNVRMEMTDPLVILSTGFAALPPKLQGDPARIESTHLSRTIQVIAEKDGFFQKAMVAEESIAFNGMDVSTDSFDSRDPRYSTNGAYDPAKRRDNGDVASNSKRPNSVDIGNGNIRGRISTGPGNMPDVGSGGAIGKAPWHDGGNTGIQPGMYDDDMNKYFPPVKEPWSGGAMTPADGVAPDGEHYEYLLGTGDYELSSLRMRSNQVLMVTGDARLYVTDTFSLSGQSSIVIAEGASLQLYVAASTASITGQGIINENVDALSFQYYGLPSNERLRFQGNAAFTGVIYAPQADFDLGGGGQDVYDFVGASVSKTVSMNGHFNFHYDEALGDAGPGGGYVVTSWREL